MPLSDGTSVDFSITFRHTEATEAIKSYVNEKLGHSVRKFIHGGNISASVVLEVEKKDHTAEIKLHHGEHDLALKASTSDLYSAIDKLASSLEVQLRKQKEKQVKGKHAAR